VAEPAEQDLQPLAIAIGEGWARELVHALRSVDRRILGAWPGTVREAQMRIRNALPSAPDVRVVGELAHVAYDAARRCWRGLAEPDPEP
jgi:hypothetical protein